MIAQPVALSESELITLFQKESTQGFELLYDTYASALYGITLTIIPDQQIAIHALQDALCQIWKELGHFDAGKMRLFTWMYQITRITALHYQHMVINHPAGTTESYTASVDASTTKLA